MRKEYLEENTRLIAERDALKAESKRLREIIELTARVLDPECPDIEAYPDGHCSLVTVAKLLKAEVAELWGKLGIAVKNGYTASSKIRISKE